MRMPKELRFGSSLDDLKPHISKYVKVWVESLIFLTFHETFST